MITSMMNTKDGVRFIIAFAPASFRHGSSRATSQTDFGDKLDFGDKPDFGSPRWLVRGQGQWRAILRGGVCGISAACSSCRTR